MSDRLLAWVGRPGGDMERAVPSPAGSGWAITATYASRRPPGAGNCARLGIPRWDRKEMACSASPLTQASKITETPRSAPLLRRPHERPRP